MHSISPYHYLNLWRNPFGEMTREERTDLAIVDLEDWVSFLTNDRSVLQFIGPCGHGKTTHLLAIERVLIQMGQASLIAKSPFQTMPKFIYFPEDGPKPMVDAHRPMIIDEAQRMSWRQARSVFRRGGPLVLSTHVDLAKQMIRAGLNVRTVDVTAAASASHLARILNRRIHASRLSDEAFPIITETDAVRLQHQFGGDIRAIEHYLYAQFQRCASEQTAWPPAT
jgi:hypothetical protein